MKFFWVKIKKSSAWQVGRFDFESSMFFFTDGTSVHFDACFELDENEIIAPQ